MVLMPDATTETSAPVPRPPRRRIAGRALGAAQRRPLFTLVALLVVAVAGMRLWRGWHVGRQLGAAEDGAGGRGGPLQAWDIPTGWAPAEQSAWPGVMRAAGLGSWSSPANSGWEYAPYPPFGGAWERAAAASEQVNAAAGV